MIGTSDKKALWVLSRQLTLEPSALQKMREHLNKCGISRLNYFYPEETGSLNLLKPTPSQHSTHPEKVGPCRMERGSRLSIQLRSISLITWHVNPRKSIGGVHVGVFQKLRIIAVERSPSKSAARLNRESCGNTVKPYKTWAKHSKHELTAAWAKMVSNHKNTCAQSER